MNELLDERDSEITKLKQIEEECRRLMGRKDEENAKLKAKVDKLEAL